MKVLMPNVEPTGSKRWGLKRAAAAAATAGALATQAVSLAAPFPPTASTNSYEGANPRAALVLSGNTLYGTTSEHAGALGGACGTIFRVDTDGRNFAVLHFFSPVSYPYPNPTNSDGGGPQAGLVLSGNTLYGTASAGGASGAGTVFKIKTDGGGFAVLHSFGPDPFLDRATNPEGVRPMAGLALSGQTLYGTTQRGGHNEGTVFRVNTDGTGFATLHTFAPLNGSDLTNWDGAFPETELLVSDKTIYGTAWSGGPAGRGTVFKLNTDGTGFTVLHSFTGKRSDPYNNHGELCNAEGAHPEAGLVLSGTTLYGTARAGGQAGNGTVFKLRTDGTGFIVLHSFTAQDQEPDILNSDGGHPKGLLLLRNTLYGITSWNGKAGWGTLFQMKTDGTGYEVLHSFGGTDGAGPCGALLWFGKTLYGTANSDGGKGGGTVYKLRADGTSFTVLHRFTKEPSPPGLTD